VKAIVTSAITLVVALLIPNGLKLAGSFDIIDLLGIFVAIGLLTAVFASLFTGISIAAKSTDSFFAVVNFLFFPVVFTSTALFPISFFPSWLEPIARANPISLASEAIRLLVVNGTLSAAQLSMFAGYVGGLLAYTIIFIALGTMLARHALKAE
jgi:ABC-2 type transport system permease protein